MSHPERDVRSGIDREAPSVKDRISLKTPQVSREAILERYRESGRSAPSTENRGRKSQAPEPDLSKLRGVRAPAPAPATKPARVFDRSEGPARRAADPGIGRARKDSIPRSDRERTRITETDSLKRLARKTEKDPEFGREILKKGRIVSSATDIATRTALSVGVGIGCGWNSGSFFWDPFYSGRNSCGPLWNWWCSPGWAWWWSSYCSPWGGYGWGFGGWSNHFGFWYGGWPGYSYPVSYYAPYPVYYSTVIYDSYDPPPSETVYVSQPAESYPTQPVAEGEGSIHVAGSRAGGAAGAIQSTASHFLTLGDQAFREGRFSDAVHYYAKAVDLEPGQGVLHLILSDALFATGDYHYAAYALRRALELDPTLVDSIVDKHTFYTEPTEFDRQLELLERYLGDHFLDDDARLLLGANYLFGGRPAQATDLLQSPFSVAIRESGAGKLLLDRAQRLREAADGR